MATITKAKINQEIIFDDETLAELKKVDGNVYIVNHNSGSVNVQLNLIDCLAQKYKQGVGLLGVLEQVRRLYISMALADHRTLKTAAQRLKVTPTTLCRHLEKCDSGQKVKQWNKKGPGDNTEAP
jgi:transcriptional regulator with PAS, ATPase and Fis domain